MAFIAAWWGIWHIVSGLVIGFFWGSKPVESIKSTVKPELIVEPTVELTELELLELEWLAERE